MFSRPTKRERSVIVRLQHRVMQEGYFFLKTRDTTKAMTTAGVSWQSTRRACWAVMLSRNSLPSRQLVESMICAKSML